VEKLSDIKIDMPKDTEILEIEGVDGPVEDISDFVQRTLRESRHRHVEKPDVLKDLREYENPTWLTSRVYGRTN
jgi:hypothetical protein